MARRSAVTDVLSMLKQHSARYPRFVLGAILAVAIAGIPLLRAEPADVFSITNIDSVDPVASGQQLTYTITVVNTGGAKVNNVVLADQINGVGGIGVPPAARADQHARRLQPDRQSRHLQRRHDRGVRHVGGDHPRAS